MDGKLKVNEKIVNGKTGYQAVGSDGTTTKWRASSHSAIRALKRLLRKKKVIKKKKPVATNDNESSINPELYGDMLERKE